MQSHTQSLLPTPQLSQEEARRYFSPKVPFGGYTIITLGIAAIVTGIFLLLNGHDILYDFIAMAIGALVVWGGLQVVSRANKANPTDEQYDQWLEEQAGALFRRGLWELSIDRSEISGPVLSFHSYVLPASQAAGEYPAQQVRMKQGKDGQWRYSLNIYTYFIPTPDCVGVLMFDINAFHEGHNRSYVHSTPYSYTAIRRVTPLRATDTVMYKGTSYPCQVEMLRLTIFDGVTTHTLEVSAAISATLKVANQKQSIPLTPKTNFDRKINQLRRLLMK